MKKHCPWCGEILKIRKIPFRLSGTCPYCDNSYTLQNSNISILIALALGLTFSIIRSIFFDFFKSIGIYDVFQIFILIAVSFFPYLNSLKKDTQKYVYEMKDKVKINFFNSQKYLNIFLSTNKIFPICFIDENDKPISLVGCVSLDIIKKKNREIIGNISYLQKGILNDKYPINTCFYIFYKKEKIGKGIIIEYIN